MAAPLLETVSESLGSPEPAVRLILSILIARCVSAGAQLYHSVVCVLVQFLMLRLMGRTVTAVLSSFTFQMIYLLAGYYYTATEEYDIKWTMPHCVLTLKLVGLSFDYYDGGKEPSQLSLEQKKAALPSVPSLLEVCGFSYFYGGFLVGPQFTLRSYQRLVARELTDSPGKPPNSVVPAMKRFSLGFLCLLIYAIFSPYYPDSYYLTAEYEAQPFWYRCVFILLWAKIVLYKYVSCWVIASPVEDVELLKAFLLPCFSAFRHVFKRLKFLGNKTLSHVTTLFFLTIWHGLHSGYILCFTMEFFIITVERQALALVRDSPLLSKLASSPLYPFIYVVQQFIHWLFMGYPLVPFCLFTYDKWLKVYSSVYFCGHIFFLATFLSIPYLRKALVPKKERRDKKQD
ncbi:lysophospholipid acyltransferase 5 [Stegastes partitus]|uniref:Lysophospholipid acyltransferase 5 n=1 Tax=Stegastes partitus TaxID=144197 RepID=A0A9Y4N011_9TELE|nr:PREDICTED: lysophospholipid acyltransferase 5 [Stegastes partitus]